MTSGAQMVCATVALGRPAMRDDVAGFGLLQAHALKAAEGEHLGHAALLDELAVVIEHLDRLVGRDRIRR